MPGLDFGGYSTSDGLISVGSVESDEIEVHLREFGRCRVLFLVRVEDSVSGGAVEALDRLLVLAAQLARRVLVREDEREKTADDARMWVGGSHVAVELQVAARERQTLVTRV